MTQTQPAGGGRQSLLTCTCLLHRWNSTFYLLVSLLDLKDPVVDTLQELAPDCAAHEFSGTEWKTMQKIVNVLKPFEEATKLLSEYDASISMAIFSVTLIVKSLESESADDVGVLSMKRALRHAMTTRFSTMEQNKRYTVATLLDSRYGFGNITQILI